MFACQSFVHQKCFNYALTNLLFGLCRSMWIIDPLVKRPNPHFGTPTHLSTPEVLRTMERTPTLYLFVIFTLDSKLNLSKSLEVCHIDPLMFSFYSKRLFRSSKGFCSPQEVYGRWSVFVLRKIFTCFMYAPFSPLMGRFFNHPFLPMFNFRESWWI
jgi:hypothetical protein